MTTNGAAAGLGQKALLAKKFAKAKYVVSFLYSCGGINLAYTPRHLDSKPTISPTDQLQSPCTAKLSNAKQRHFAKFVMILAFMSMFADHEIWYRGKPASLSQSFVAIRESSGAASSPVNRKTDF